MMNINENDLKIHKYFAENIVIQIEPLKIKFQKIIERQINKIHKLERLIAECENIDKINKLTLDFQNEKELFLKNLSICLVLNDIENKNRNRCLYIEDKFAKLGIYNKNFDKKELKGKLEQITKIEIDEDLIINNCGFSGDYLLFFEGHNFYIHNGRLDFQNQQNFNILNKNVDIALKLALKKYPDSILTIPIKLMFNINFKKKVLIYLTQFIADKMVNHSFKQINGLLGNLLNFSLVEPSSIKEFVLEIENYFNVKIKEQLMLDYPQLADDINRKLKCDKNSKYL